MRSCHLRDAALVLLQMLTLTLLVTGCRAKSTSPANPMEAAIVPNADFILRCNVKSARAAPFAAKVLQIKKENEATDPAAKAKAAQRARITDATGLTQDDVDEVLMSAELARVNFREASGAATLGTIPAVLAIGLAKPLSLDQLRAAATVMSELRPATSVGDVTLDGVTAVVIHKASSNDSPTYAATSADGRTVYITLNETTLRDTLARHRQGKPGVPSPALVDAEKRLSPEFQLRTILIAPDALRQAIKDQVATGQKTAGPAAMFMGLVKPFENIQNASLFARLATEARLTFDMELGTPQDAAQVAAIIPLLQGMVPRNPAGGFPDLGRALSVTNSGSHISMTLLLTEGNLTPGQPPPASNAL